MKLLRVSRKLAIEFMSNYNIPQNIRPEVSFLQNVYVSKIYFVLTTVSSDMIYMDNGFR